MKKIGFFLLASTFLVACANYTSVGEKYYLQSRNGMTVVVPPPLTDSNISHFYDLPPQTMNPEVRITPPYGEERKR